MAKWRKWVRYKTSKVFTQYNDENRCLMQQRNQQLFTCQKVFIGKVYKFQVTLSFCPEM